MSDGFSPDEALGLYRGLVVSQQARIGELEARLARCGNIAGMCRDEMQGRLSDDEHRRAFRALGAVQMEALGGKS